MNKMLKAVQEFVDREVGGAVIDPDILELCIKAMTPAEQETILMGDSVSIPPQHESYFFVLAKAFYRHNDVIARRSMLLDNGDIEITLRSSITELDISYNTLVNCNKNCVFHIEDIQKKLLPSLTFESIADITAALISFNSEVE